MCVLRTLCLLLAIESFRPGGRECAAGNGVFASELIYREPYASVPHIIEDAGYPVERHRVHTEDGYILQMHRIPAGRRTSRRVGDSRKMKKPVLLVHGLMGSSGDAVIMGPERSIAYLLADSGYDVWLANMRGTAYSAHVNFTKSDPQFWEFSFEEHGRYDAPAFVEKILSVTGVPRVLYLGYSMGTTSFFVMLSERPEMNDKLVAFVGLAPAVFMDNVRPLARSLIQGMDWTNELRTQGVYKLSLRRELRDLLANGLCNVRRSSEDLCMRALYGLVGEDYEQNDWEVMPTVIARVQPASLRQIEHFGKVAITGKFLKWGEGMNDLSAPAYNLSEVRIPIHLVYGKNDQLTEKSQVWRLANKLRMPSSDRTIRSVSWRKFNHLDFMFAKEVDRILNKQLIAMIDDAYARDNDTEEKRV